jgi:YD repeat-containing protein
VTSVTDQRGKITTFGYNNRGLRTSTAYPNGLTQEARWDDSRRLSCIYAYTGAGPGNGQNVCPAASTSLLTFFKYDYTAPGGVDTTTRYGVTSRPAPPPPTPTTP